MKKYLIITFATLVFITGAMHYLTPIYVKNITEKTLSKAFNTKVMVQHVSVKLLSKKIVLHNIAIENDEFKPVLLKMTSITFDKLFAKNKVIDLIKVKGLDIEYLTNLRANNIVNLKEALNSYENDSTYVVKNFLISDLKTDIEISNDFINTTNVIITPKFIVHTPAKEALTVSKIMQTTFKTVEGKLATITTNVVPTHYQLLDKAQIKLDEGKNTAKEMVNKYF